MSSQMALTAPFRVNALELLCPCCRLDGGAVQLCVL